MASIRGRVRTATASAPTPGRRGLVRVRFAYRRGQNLLLTALAALMMIAIVGAPLYERLVEQESLRATLSNADRESRGIEIARSLFDAPPGGDQLMAEGLRWFHPGVSSVSASVAFVNDQSEQVLTSLTYRQGQCQHLTFDSGGCPTGGIDAAMSSSAAAKEGIRVGARIDITADLPDDPPVIATVRIVGLYRPFNPDDDYWFGHRYSTLAGVTRYPDFSQVADDIFVGPTTLNMAAGRAVKAGTTRPATEETDFALRPEAPGVDDIGALGHLVASLPNTDTVRSTTQLPSYLDQVDRDRGDVRRVVVVTAAQLALLAAIAFGVVVVAAADQRKQEFALARLRGRSPTRTTGVFTRELAALVVAAAIPALGLSWLAAWSAGRFMTFGVSPEFRWPVVGALVLAVLVAVAVVIAVGTRQSRLPVGDLLREVAPARARRGLTTLETAVGVLALAGLAAAFQGGRASVLGTLTPTFLAALVAIVVVRLTTIVARRRAQRILRRGSLTAALAAFSVARRPGGRLLVTLICLATALAVFTAQQWSIAAAARSQRAQVDVGAAAVVQVDTPALSNLEAAVGEADPNSSWATPVVTVTPPNADVTPLLAVDPGPFSRIADWGRDALRPTASQFAALTPKVAPPITLRGDAATLTLTGVAWSESPLPPDPDRPVVDEQPIAPEIYIGLVFYAADARTITAEFGPLPSDAAQLALTAPVDCAGGCRLIRVGVDRPRAGDSAGVQVRFGVTGLAGTSSSGATETPAKRLGTASQWQSITANAPITGSTLAASAIVNDAGSQLSFVINDGGNGSTVQYLNQPVQVPALVAGAIPGSDSFETPGLYARPVTMHAIGAIPFAPRVGAPVYLVNLGLVGAGASATSSKLDITAHPTVWSRFADASHLAQLTAALQKHDVGVVKTSLTTQERDALADSGPALSSDLALVVGAIAELLALGLLFLIVITSRRPRQRDLASLRLLGMPRAGARRATSAELMTLVLTGVLAGAAAGIVGAVVAVPGVPFFATSSAVPIPTSYALQIPWLVGTVVVGAVLLVLGAWFMAGRLVRRRRADRLSQGAM